jgi:hypothetical protein
VAFVLLAFLQGTGVFIYVVLWLVMPERIEGGTASPASSPPDQTGAPAAPIVRYGSAVIPGVVLVVVGVFFLGVNIGLVSWSVVWPAALIVLGILLLVRTFDRRT